MQSIMKSVRCSIVDTFLPLFLCCFIFFSESIWALPIDWQGGFGADSNLLFNYKRTKDPYVANDGSQQIPSYAGDRKKASFQSYLLKLGPSIIINDMTSFFGEVTTGYGYGGMLGDSSSTKQTAAGSNSFGDALYLQNNSDGRSNLVFNQFNLKIFADSATYIIGRQTFHWGLGAVFNEGANIWDRHKTIQDGITVKFKVGNLQFGPYWAKINSLNTLSPTDDTQAYGATFLYDSVEKGVTFGLLYGKKISETYSTFYMSGQNHNLGRADILITDIYMKKNIDDFSFSIEAPRLSGDLGNVFSPDQNTKYKAYAIINESNYKINDSWNVGAFLGLVSGEDGLGPEYKAMYLNPNYQLANILFRYNLFAVGDANQSIYDSYVVNTIYAKLHGQYQTGAWTFDSGVLLAKAKEVAKGSSQPAFNHSNNKRFTSEHAQDSYLGTELDAGFSYQWNNNLTIHGAIGYLFVGDYFNYTNTSTEVNTQNCYSGTIGIVANF